MVRPVDDIEQVRMSARRDCIFEILDTGCGVSVDISDCIDTTEREVVQTDS